MICSSLVSGDPSNSNESSQNPHFTLNSNPTRISEDYLSKYRPTLEQSYHLKEYFPFSIASWNWRGVSISITFFSFPGSTTYHIYFLCFQTAFSVFPPFVDSGITLIGSVLSFTYIFLIFQFIQRLWKLQDKLSYMHKHWGFIVHIEKSVLILIKQQTKH